MRKHITALICIISLSMHAQESESTLNNTELKIGYYGNLLWNNGINLGAEHTWKERDKIKERKKGPKTILRQVLLNGNIGYSTNFTNQTENGLHTHFGLIWRRTSPKRWQLNLALSPLGYYRSFLPETYEVKGEKVKQVRFPGRSYYAPSFALGIGRLRKEKKHSGWNFGLKYTLRTPYNAGTLPTLAIQYTHRFRLKNNK